VITFGLLVVRGVTSLGVILGVIGLGVVTGRGWVVTWLCAALDPENQRRALLNHDSRSAAEAVTLRQLMTMKLTNAILSCLIGP